MSLYHTIQDQNKPQADFHVYASSDAKYTIEEGSVHSSSGRVEVTSSFQLQEPPMTFIYYLNPKAEIPQQHLWNTKDETKETRCNCGQSSAGVMIPCGPDQKICAICKQTGMWLCVGLAA
jgi:hypothetical protein